jgi:hypothetical protein
MSWIVKRKTTVKEDKAYCLLGIFEAFMPLIFGEGETTHTVGLERQSTGHWNGS